MTNKWQLTEQQLKELLLVSHVKLNVPVCDFLEEVIDETSESIDPDRNQATAQSGEHD